MKAFSFGYFCPRGWTARYVTPARPWAVAFHPRGLARTCIVPAVAFPNGAEQLPSVPAAWVRQLDGGDRRTNLDWTPDCYRRTDCGNALLGMSGVSMEKKWWTLLAVCTGTFMLLLDVTIVVVAIPDIQRGLHATFGQIQWVIDAYALTLASLLLTAGVLADRYGRRLLFAVGLVIFTLGSLLSGLALDPLMLILSRSGQGIGGAIMYATSLALLGHSFQGKDRGVAFGVWGAITGVAVSLGPILGGVITTGISWRAIFLVNVPIGLAAVAITWWRVEESRAPQPGRPDWTGFALLTAGLVSLVYGLIRAGETSWGNAGVLICLVLGGILLVGFTVAEARVRDPMFDLGLFRVPTFDGGLIAAFCMNGSLFSMLLYLVLYLQYALGYSALQTGLRLLLISGPTLITATVAGRLSERVPVRWLIGPGLVLVGAGLFLMSGLSATSSWTHLVPGFIIAGAGAGFVNPPLASTAIGVVEPRTRRNGLRSEHDVPADRHRSEYRRARDHLQFVVET